MHVVAREEDGANVHDLDGLVELSGGVGCAHLTSLRCVWKWWWRDERRAPEDDLRESFDWLHLFLLPRGRLDLDLLLLLLLHQVRGELEVRSEEHTSELQSP